MKRIILNPENKLTAKTVPAIIEKPIHRGLQFYYPSNYPSWAVFRSQMLALAKRTAQRAKYPFAFTGLIAALAYDIPTMHLPLRLELRYTDRKERGNSRVGKTEDSRGIPVIRLKKPIPPEAINQVADLPVLDPIRFLLEILSYSNLRNALAGGDALVRRLLQPGRQLSPAQVAEFNQLLANARSLAPSYLPASQAELALRRLALLSPLAESPLESMVRADLLETGLVGFVEQFEIITQGGVFYADFYLPVLNLVLECDGEGKYVLDPDHVNEKSRQQLIEAAGFEVLRISWEQAKDPSFVRRLFKRDVD